MRHYVICGMNRGRMFKNHKWNVTTTADHQPDMDKFIQEMQPTSSLNNKVIVNIVNKYLIKYYYYMPEACNLWSDSIK